MIVEFIMLKVHVLDMFLILQVFYQHSGLVLTTGPTFSLKLRLETIAFDASFENFELHNG